MYIKEGNTMYCNRTISKLLRTCVAGSLIFATLFSAIACNGADTAATTVDSKTDSREPSTSTTIANTSAVSDTPITDAPSITTEALPSDTTPPTVSGSDFEIVLGDSVSYRKQITVSDDCDENPTIAVDNSAVDLDTPGVYPVIYTVTDSAGNSTVLTLQMTIIKEIVPAPTEAYVLDQAEKILQQIAPDAMSDLEVAYAVYRWTKYNISYLDSSDKTNWLVGAYNGFTTRRGDCFTYYAVAKALLTAAGIDNVDMVKYRTSEQQSRHYWLLVNVGTGWYHFDATPYVYKNSNFFMVTDEELSSWDAKYYKGAHNFIEEGLPERATESMQDRVNYSSTKLNY